MTPIAPIRPAESLAPSARTSPRSRTDTAIDGDDSYSTHLPPNQRTSTAWVVGGPCLGTRGCLLPWSAVVE